MTDVAAIDTSARTTRFDGRELRARETRERIIVAVRQLAGAGIYLAPPDTVAAQAGCCPRSLYQHFGSMAALRMAAFTDAHIAAIDSRLGATPAERVRAWVTQQLPANKSSKAGTQPPPQASTIREAR